MYVLRYYKKTLIISIITVNACTKRQQSRMFSQDTLLSVASLKFCHTRDNTRKNFSVVV